MSGHKGLAKWFKQDWVDIGAKKKGGGFKKCGRSKLKSDRKKISQFNKGGMARACGAIKENKRKITKFS